MKKLLFLALIILSLSINGVSQIYKADWVIKETPSFSKENKSRVITITDKEISITKFIGNTETQYLIVNKIVDKDWPFMGTRKTYYCTTKDNDPINGYQKAIVIKSVYEITFVLFADEITIFKYTFLVQ